MSWGARRAPKSARHNVLWFSASSTCGQVNSNWRKSLVAGSVGICNVVIPVTAVVSRSRSGQPGGPGSSVKVKRGIWVPQEPERGKKSPVMIGSRGSGVVWLFGLTTTARFVGSQQPKAVGKRGTRLATGTLARALPISGANHHASSGSTIGNAAMSSATIIPEPRTRPKTVNPSSLLSSGIRLSTRLI